MVYNIFSPQVENRNRREAVELKKITGKLEKTHLKDKRKITKKQMDLRDSQPYQMYLKNVRNAKKEQYTREALESSLGLDMKENIHDEYGGTASTRKDILSVPTILIDGCDQRRRKIRFL